MNKYSEYYYEVIEKYKLFHKNGTKKMSGSRTFAGYSLTKWIIKIKEIIDHSNSSSLIDYGCGKGFLYNNKFRIGNKEYDGLSKLWDINEIFSTNYRKKNRGDKNSYGCDLLKAKSIKTSFY